MQIDYYILAFSAITVVVTIWMGFRSAKTSKTASDFFVAGRSVSVGWNASAISGEYLSAASFMGIAGMVMSSGYDALWYPVCYACGYLFLLLFIAGPLRRFGAYTIPDFAEGRFDSPLFRKIAVCFVLFIGFFYTMPQMKGAGTTLAYIFPGLPYWAGVVLVGAVITLNVALGGMKGITLVQAFQYWAKMFAISVPIFVLMAVYGHYGKQVGVNGGQSKDEIPNRSGVVTRFDSSRQTNTVWLEFPAAETGFFTGIPTNIDSQLSAKIKAEVALKRATGHKPTLRWSNPTWAFEGKLHPLPELLTEVAKGGQGVLLDARLERVSVPFYSTNMLGTDDIIAMLRQPLATNGISVTNDGAQVWVFKKGMAAITGRAPLSEKNPADGAWFNLVGPTNQIAVSTSVSLPEVNGWVTLQAPQVMTHVEDRLKSFFGQGQHYSVSNAKLVSVLLEYAILSGRAVIAHTNVGLTRLLGPLELNRNDWKTTLAGVEQFLKTNGVVLRDQAAGMIRVMTVEQAAQRDQQWANDNGIRKPLPEKAPADSTWLSPFGPLTTKAAKAAAANLVRPDWNKRATLVNPDPVAETPEWRRNLELLAQGKLPEGAPRGPVKYGTGDEGKPLSEIAFVLKHWAHLSAVLCESNLLTKNIIWNSTNFQSPAALSAALESGLSSNGVSVIRASESERWLVSSTNAQSYLKPLDTKPYSLLYTYSLIIALVCGTAGLPHILVRFYTNPDGVAAKRTTMWVMILIGIFYVFPPVFGVMGRNLFPELYNGIGAKGTDKIVLELPRLLNEKYAPLGSILSGITCAGAFAAFMSTFSGLLVSMTGAMAHDVYGRMLRPKSTPEQRMKMFKISAVILGGGAILGGSFVEALEINFMVGQAFAIAAASYFPLLFMAVWWRKLTMKGAATGMLTGGLSAVFAISLSSFSTLAATPGKTGEMFAMFKPLNDFWPNHPLLRILCDQPAIWAVPLAIGLMIIISKLTQKDVPSDIRMKMLVLHAPEKLGLKQEYIQEHQAGGH